MTAIVSMIKWGTGEENLLLLDYPLDNIRHYRKRRPGSSRVRIPGAGYDTWDFGKDYMLEADVRWLSVAKFGGPLGVQEFIDWAGSGTTTFSFVPDATVPDFSIPGCYLEAPFESPEPGSEQSGEQTVRLIIGNPTYNLSQALRGLMFEYVPGLSLTDPVAATVSRSTTAFRTAVNRVMTSEAVNALRDRHYSPGGLHTTLLEPARAATGWDRSEELDHGNWTKVGATVGANAFRGGDGTLTSDTLIESALNEAHAFVRNTPALTDNTLQSVAVCSGFFTTRTWFRIKTINKANTQISTWFNIASGAVGTIGGGHTNVRMELVGPVGAQSYRCSLTFDAGVGGTTPAVEFHMATGDGGGSYAGDGTSRMAFWGMQFDPDSPFIGSYVKDGGARGADLLTWPFSYKPQALFLFEEFVEAGSILTAAAATRNLGISDPTAPRMGIYKSTTGYEGYHANTAFRSSQVTSAIPVLGDLVQHCLAIDSQGRPQLRQAINGGGDVAASLGAAEPFTDAFGSPTLVINSTRLGTNQGSNEFRRVKIGPLTFNGVTRDTIAKALAA